MKIQYVSKSFSQTAAGLIATCNQIMESYAAQGFDITLRQLYYQLVSRAIIANKQTEYKRLGELINDARLAGLVDWDHIVDRTRFIRENPHWDSPASIVDACATQYREERWRTQPYHVEVWIEKDALVGVLDTVCRDLDVVYFSCRGYTSVSELYSAAMRLVRKVQQGKRVVVIHLGDHDPSGIDMTRDITDRLHLLMTPKYAKHLSVNRIALNWDQIEQYDPPPNPAKITDSRAQGYIAAHGGDSWELDALEPTVLVDLIRGAVEEYIDFPAMDKAVESERAGRTLLSRVSRHWDRVGGFVAGLNGDRDPDGGADDGTDGGTDGGATDQS